MDETQQETELAAPETKESFIEWLFRLAKGMFIGTGAILPGVSGGALAAVFGLYERIIAFLANPRKNFVRNVLFFIPVGVGFLLGIFVLTFPLHYFLEHNEVQVLFFFIGAIVGTLPALSREASKRGRESKHLILAVAIAVIFLAALIWARTSLNVHMPLNFGTWILAGAIFALGMIVPGLSPSNFLFYLHMYTPMMDGIKNLNPDVLIPVGIGAVLCIVAFAKLMSKLLEAAYTTVFHVILGVVIASTAIILPWGSAYAGMDTLDYVITGALAVAGLALGLWMGQLEKKYKKDEE